MKPKSNASRVEAKAATRCSTPNAVSCRLAPGAKYKTLHKCDGEYWVDTGDECEPTAEKSKAQKGGKKKHVSKVKKAGKAKK
jgi:hypothetical protein